jgi:hypothetical protein
MCSHVMNRQKSLEKQQNLKQVNSNKIISKPYFVKKSSNGEFLCLNAHNCTLESKDVQVHSFGHNSRKTQWTGI